MRRVLLTGSTGLLGSSVAAALKSGGWSVIRHARRAAELSGDLTDRDVAATAVNESRADCVVNLAALTNVDTCERHPREAYLQNTRVVENLARAIKAAEEAVFLVHISTDQVYDSTGPHAEDDVTLTNYYGFSKYAGELAAMTVPGTVLRTNFFGPSRCAGRQSFSDWIVAALKKQESVQVFDDILFSPLSLDRLSELICLTVDRRVGGVFNLGSRAGMSKAEFCFTLAHTLDLPTGSMKRASSSASKLLAYRPKDMRMDCRHFESAFGVALPTCTQEIESMKGCYFDRA